MDIQKYEHRFLWDEPCEFNKVLIYPVRMVDYYNYMISLQCLTLPKNRSRDINIIRMNYFDYLFYMAGQDEVNLVYISLLQMFLASVFRNQVFRLIEFENAKFGIGVMVEDEEVIILSDEFEDIKELILAQNETKLIYPELDETLEEELERAKRIKTRLNKETPTADLEDIVTALMVITGMKPVDIKEMTIRKFNKAITRICMIEDYRVYKSAEAGGMVEFKTPIPHWLSKQVDADKNEELKMTTEQFSSKMGDVASISKLGSQQNE